MLRAVAKHARAHLDAELGEGQVAMLEIRRVVERVHEDRSACARKAQGENVAVVCLAAFQEIERGFAEREGVAEHGQAAGDERGWFGAGLGCAFVGHGGTVTGSVSSSETHRLGGRARRGGLFCRAWGGYCGMGGKRLGSRGEGGWGRR